MAFDFDGTLTVKDSFNAFLAWRTPGISLVTGAVRMVPAALRYLIDRDRGRLKAAAVRTWLKGLSRDQLAASAEAFAQASYDRLMRPDALAVWNRHRQDGARLVIVTASPDLVVEPFARRLGADRLLGTRLAFDAAGRVTGALAGPNCRGEEKVRRLQAAFGRELRLAAAYGDTSGDREMLAAADRGFLRVFQGRPEPRR